MDIFIDSSALISIIIETDTNYKKANAFINSIDENTNIYSTSLVYCECMTVISQRFGLENAKNFSKFYKKLPVNLLDVDEYVIKSAEKILFSQKSKNLSFFDCVYASLVKSNNLDGIFTYDTDFNKLGVKVLG